MLNYILYLLSFFYATYYFVRLIIIATRSEEKEKQIEQEMNDVKISFTDADQNKEKISKLTKLIDFHFWVNISAMIYEVAGLFSPIRFYFIAMIVLNYLPVILKAYDGDYTTTRHQRIMIQIINIVLYGAVIYKFHLLGY